MEQTDFAGAIKEKYASAASKSYQVYYDSALTQRVDITIKRDYDAKSVTMIVTVFTTKEEMNTPTLTQGVAEDGNYRLSWSAVEGADYYEVYEYHPGMDFAALEVATSDTSCTYSEFQTAIDYETSFKETFAGTEVDVDEQYLMNCMLDMENGYFVVARKNDGTHSGMSNTCMLSEIAGQIPYTVSDNFVREYEGDTALCLPAYVDLEMMDGSTSQFLIQYSGSKITLLEDNSIVIDCSIKNLSIEMPSITFRGMDWDSFRAGIILTTVFFLLLPNRTNGRIAYGMIFLYNPLEKPREKDDNIGNHMWRSMA